MKKLPAWEREGVGADKSAPTGSSWVVKSGRKSFLSLAANDNSGEHCYESGDKKRQRNGCALGC